MTIFLYVSRREATARAARRGIASAPLLAAVAFLAGCTVGPDYQRPAAPVPVKYKEGEVPAGWRPGRPGDAIDRGMWWSIYRDPVLNDLERQIDISNQNLKSAEAAFRQSEALVAAARAEFFPTLAIGGSAERSRSGGSSIRSGGTTTSTTATSTTTAAGATAGAATGSTVVGTSGRSGSGTILNSFGVSASASWTPDLWGRIRRTVESDVANAQASAADLASARLSAQGSLASDYLQLRMSDELKRLLDEAVVAYSESLRITKNQFAAGTAAQSDVSQAQAQLDSTRAQAIAVGVTRAQLEHAIAVLVGKPPGDFAIAPSTQAIAIPDVPPELPSALLERRPDIAAGERQMASSNALVGVAVSAFYPDITLSADYGVSSFALNKLFTASSRVWSFGSSLAQTIFDGGARSAQVEQARAAYDQSVANYRQTVLTAFQQVEDELAATRILTQQAAAQDSAVAAARDAERIINNQYKAGTVAYTSVIVAETTALGDAESAVSIRQSRLTASAALIQALGGGWQNGSLPDRDRIESDSPLDFNPLPPILPSPLPSPPVSTSAPPGRS